MMDLVYDGNNTRAHMAHAVPGNKSAPLSWPDVTNASAYEILRTEGVVQCGQGVFAYGLKRA